MPVRGHGRTTAIDVKPAVVGRLSLTLYDHTIGNIIAGLAIPENQPQRVFNVQRNGGM